MGIVEILSDGERSLEYGGVGVEEAVSRVSGGLEGLLAMVLA